MFPINRQEDLERLEARAHPAKNTENNPIELPLEREWVKLRSQPRADPADGAQHRPEPKTRVQTARSRSLSAPPEVPAQAPGHIPELPVTAILLQTSSQELSAWYERSRGS